MAKMRYAFLKGKYAEEIYKHMKEDPAYTTWAGDNVNEESCFEYLAQYDPTHEKEKYAYLDWICRQYLKSFQKGHRHILGEDLYKIKEDLTYFNEKKRFLDQDKRDINKYDIDNLIDLVEDLHRDVKISNRELRKQAKADIYAQTRVLYNGKEGMIVSPKTKKAAIFWGQSTRWCTSSTQSENVFTRYNKKGPLIIYIPSTSESEDNFQDKYQGHCGEHAIKDQRDETVEKISENLATLIKAAIKTRPDLWKTLIMDGSINVKDVPSETMDWETMWEYLVQKPKFWEHKFENLGEWDDNESFIDASMLVNPIFMKEITEREKENEIENYFEKNMEQLIALLPEANWTTITPKTLWLNTEFCTTLLGSGYIPENLQNDKNFWNTAPEAEDLPESTWQNQKLLLLLIQNDPDGLKGYLEYVPEHLWDDQNFFTKAIKVNSNVKHFASEDLQYKIEWNKLAV